MSNPIVPTRLPPFPITYLDTSKVTRFSPDDYAQMAKVAQELAINPADDIYGIVKANGMVVATVYNSGAWTSANDSYSKIHKLPGMNNATETDPALAQTRAETIAKAFKGIIEKWVSPVDKTGLSLDTLLAVQDSKK